MAIRGVSLSETEEVILPHDPGHPENPAFKAAIKKGSETEFPTKFLIGNLTKGCRTELGDMTTSPTMRDGGVTLETKRTRRNYEIAQRGLRGWDNMLDHGGKPVKFERETIKTQNGHVVGASDASMMHLSQDDIDALAVLIFEKNGMTRKMEGNFAGVLPQFAGQPSETGAANTAQTTSSESEAVLPPQ